MWGAVAGAVASGVIGSMLDKDSNSETESRTTQTKNQSNVADAITKYLLEGGELKDGEVFSADGSGSIQLGEREQALLKQLDQAIAGSTGDLQDASTDALTRMLSGEPLDFEEFYKTNIQDPALENFERDVSPALSRQFAGRLGGSEYREFSSRATEDLLKSLTRERGKLAFDTQQQALQQTLEAIGLTPGVQMGQINPLVAALQAAGIETGLKERNIEREFQMWLEQQGVGNTRIAEALQFLNIPQLENISTVTPGSQSTLSGVSQGLASNPALFTGVGGNDRAGRSDPGPLGRGAGAGFTGDGYESLF